ncbi:MAG: SRPBCC family protein [Sphingomonadaceae bacterium]|nr:SRPBCC family protein [Sphingomonadaceae bacterium]
MSPLGTLRPAAAAPGLEHAHALDPRYYVEDGWLDHELRHVFRAGWQWAGTRSTLAKPGDYLTADLPGGSAVIVMREDGQLAAYRNLCRHRAGPLAEGCGNAGRLRCRYHGWTYGLDGQLRSAPEMGTAQGFDPADYPLYPVGVAEFQSHVFVALAPAQAPPFTDMAAGIAERIAPETLAGMELHSTQTYEVECNWKVYVDNYLEGYHVPYVHPALVGPIDYGQYITELAEWSSLQHTAVADDDPAYGGGRMWYYFVWPNTMLNVVSGRLQLNQVVPLGPRRTRVLFGNFYTPEAVTRAEADLAFTATVQEEDAAICAAVDRNLRAGIYTPGRLSPRREAGVWHFQSLLRAAYARA